MYPRLLDTGVISALIRWSMTSFKRIPLNRQPFLTLQSTYTGSHSSSPSLFAGVVVHSLQTDLISLMILFGHQHCSRDVNIRL